MSKLMVRKSIITNTIRHLPSHIYRSLRSVYTDTACKQFNSPILLLLSIPKNNIRLTNKVQYYKWLKGQQQQQQYYLNKQLRFYSSTTTTTALTDQQQQQQQQQQQHSNASISSINDLSNIPKDDPLLLSSTSGKILSAALEQSDLNIAHCLIDTTLQLLRRKDPELAWECYTDLSVRNMLRYITSDQFNQLIKRFAHQTKHGQGLDYVLALVEDMKQLGYQMGRKEKLIVMRLLGMNGKLKEMEAVFEDLSKQQLLLELDNDIQKPFNILLSCYQEHVGQIGKKAMVEKSMATYGSMLDRGIQPSQAATRILVDNIRIGGYTNEMTNMVWSWFWSKIGMQVGSGNTRDLDPSLYKEMVLFFSSAGRPEYALAVNDMMTKKNIPRDRKMMVALMHKVGRSGDIKKSMSLLNEMMVVEEINPDVITFNALLDIHAHQKPQPDVAGAGQVYTMMQELGIQPDVITYGTLIDMFAKQGDLSMVRQLYKRMMQHTKPTPHIYSSLIECFVNNDDQKSALEVLRILHKGGIKDVKPTKVMYNILIKSYVEKNDIRHAMMLINLLNDAKLTMDARTFTPLLSYFAKRGDTANTEAIVDMMDKMMVEKHPFTYTTIVEAYAKAEDMETTEILFDEFKQHMRPNGHLYSALLYVYVKKNKIDKVFQAYRQMLQTSIQMTEHTYGILMYCYSKRGEPRAVEALMKTMQENGIKPGVICWNILMQSYFKTQHTENAKQIVELMMQSGVEPNWTTWSILINGLVNNDDPSLAESVLRNTIEHQKQKLHKQQLSLLNNNDHHHPFGDFAMLANVTHDRYKKPEEMLYTQQLPMTIEDLLDQKQHYQNKNQLSIIPPPYLFTSLIRKYVNLHQFDKARDIVKIMLEHKTPFNSFIYTTLMKLYKEEKRYDIVENMWNMLGNNYSYNNNNNNNNNNQYQLSTVSSLQPSIYLDGIGDIPLLNIDKKGDSADDILLDFHSNNDNDTTTIDQFEHFKLIDSEKDNASTPSTFILSIYIDTLNDQQRYNDIENIWSKLKQEGYSFDVHNWNRYIASLLKKNDIQKACHVTYENVLNLNQLEAKYHKRSSDNFIRYRDFYLHHETCRLFAEAFNIQGYKGMGIQTLYSSVTDHINYWVENDLESYKEK
ncbi:unnamed protein product [Cunninghamella echinulata]